MASLGISLCYLAVNFNYGFRKNMLDSSSPHWATSTRLDNDGEEELGYRDNGWDVHGSIGPYEARSMAHLPAFKSRGSACSGGWENIALFKNCPSPQMDRHPKRGTRIMGTTAPVVKCNISTKFTKRRTVPRSRNLLVCRSANNNVRGSKLLDRRNIRAMDPRYANLG